MRDGASSTRYDRETLHRILDEAFVCHLGATAGEKVCITVTLLDGLVFARSAFHHSANFRSVMRSARGHLVDGPDEKHRALHSMLEKFSPDGRPKRGRPMRLK